MRKVVMLVLSLFVIAFFATVVHAQTQSAPAGQKLFVDNKCNTCHSVTSAQIEKKMAAAKGTDLSNAGATHDAAWFTKWLNKEVDLEGKKHPASVKLPDADLKTLVDWLATLKTKTK